MATATQMKCACEPCLCIVTPDDSATEKDGKYYCSQVCADGHPDGHGDCGHKGCNC
ncbi:MAG: metallothionein [Myxacorys californica WJT36-NPBG1]|nr:metallothionein [Myxacorys californica WJT36-NPBG1]